MDLAAFEWLLTPDGQELLARADRLHAEESAADAAPPDPVRLTSRLREADDTARPEHASAALTQVALRRRAEPRFGDLAHRMYFTPEGLEQATRRSVAEHRAGRVAAAQPASVLDAGCGVGGDLVALAGTGLTVAGVDTDPLRVAVARANLATLGLPGAVQAADATTLDLDGFAVVFADPSRRTPRGRVFDVADYTPSWSFVETLLGRASCVKLAPGIPRDLVPVGVEAEWVSDHGEVKEACLWSSWLATVRRRATVIGDGGLATLTDHDDPLDPDSEGDVPLGPVGRFLYEPDGAVIRAGLVTAVAAGVGGRLVEPHTAYVTGDAAYRTPFARGYEVLETLPYREKALRAALRERHIGRLTIKKRGVDVAPDRLRKRLDLRGPEEATLVLTRADTGTGRAQGTALLVRPF